MKKGRLIKTRLYEQQRRLRSGLLSKFAVCEHQFETDHQVHFDSASVVGKIIKHPFHINREAG